MSARRFPLQCVATGLALALALGAQGADREKEAVQVDVKQPSVEQQIVRVEHALSSEHYSELSLEDKSKVRAALNRIRMTMGNKTTVEELAPGPRTELLNDQELVNVLLTQAHADSRMVCRRERTIGSNFPKTQCLTVAQRRRAMEVGQDELRRGQQVHRQQL